MPSRKGFSELLFTFWKEKCFYILERAFWKFCLKGLFEIFPELSSWNEKKNDEHKIQFTRPIANMREKEIIYRNDNAAQLPTTNQPRPVKNQNSFYI